MVKAGFAVSLAQMTAYFMAHPVNEAKSQKIAVGVSEGSLISANRDMIINRALNMPEITHVMFIDDDMGFPQDAIHQLAKHKLPIVACNYKMRFPPGEFTAVNTDKVSRVITTDESTGLVEAAFSGFGMCLIERRVFEAIPQPRFMIRFNEDSKQYSTEDVTFFEKARAKGFPCMIDQDLSKRIWHSGSLNYLWYEDYSDLNMNFRVNKAA